MPDRMPMTKQGYERLQEQKKELNHKRFELLEAVKSAREKGDLNENAEYHAARESLAIVETKIAQVEGILALADIVDVSKAPADVATFGCKVRVLDLDSNEEETFALVGHGEADPLDNKILTTSPLGAALLRKRAGDELELPVPRGILRYRVLEISRDTPE